MKKLVTALFLIFATFVWAGDLEDGNAALGRGDFEAAAEHFKRAANEGDPISQYNLGLMYERGDGVHQDFAQAIHLYKQAAAQGDVDAQNNLARLLKKE
jgi:TPR repeat protein